MRILVNEIYKVIKSPIIIGLSVLFVLFNTFIITEKYQVRDELKILNKMVRDIGYKIDNEMIDKFKAYHENSLEKANNILFKNEGKTYSSIGEYLNSNKKVELSEYPKEDYGIVLETLVIENYYNFIGENDEKFKQINLSEIAEKNIKSIGVTGAAAESIRDMYKDIQERMDTIKMSGEYRNLFFDGATYEMHSFLFGSIMRIVVFECSILGCLIMLLLVNYEFDNGTKLISYSSKRGRHLVKDKILAGLIGIVAFTTIIVGITMTIYFSMYSYKGLWNIPVSNYFNWERTESIPYLSFFNLSIWQYLVAFIILIYIIQIIFGGITFLVARIMKNTYISFFIFLIMWGLGVIFPTFMPTSSSLIIYSTFSPFYMTVITAAWLMINGILTSYKYYELITLGFWGVLIFVAGFISVRRFNRENIN